MNKFRVWWIPQVPMSSVFYVPVRDAREGRLTLNTLANYDQFQFDNNIKPDYVNVGGLEVLDDNEWVDWNDDDGYDIDEFRLNEEGELEFI